MPVKIKLIAVILCMSVAPLFAQVGFKLSTNDPVIDETTEDQQVQILHDGDTATVYRTPSIIRYQYSVARMELLQPVVNQLMDQLNRNSQEPGNLFPPDVVERKLDSVDALNRTIAVMKKEQDSLFFAYKAEYVNYRKCTFFPGTLGARAVFDVVYGNGGERFKAMGNAGVLFGNNGTASIYSEVVSGNMGLIRVGFGTMLSSDDDNNDSISQSDQAYQRLIANGGNTVLSLEYPMFYGSWLNNQSNAIVRPMMKASADFPAFGTSTDKWAGCGMIGLDAYIDIATDNNQIRFFANANSFYVVGTDIYQSNLSVTSPDFSFGQLTLGMVFLENFKLSVIVGTWSSQNVLEKRRVAIGGQVLR